MADRNRCGGKVLEDQNADSAGRPKVWIECFLLCDYASVDNNKMYIVGGGWEHITPAQLPVPYTFSLAIKLVATTTAAPMPMSFRVEELDPVSSEAGHVLIGFDLDVNAPPEDVEASRVALMVPLTVNVMLNAPGKRVLRLVVNDEALAFTQFRILPPAIVVEGGEEEELDQPVSSPEELLARDRAAGRA